MAKDKKRIVKDPESFKDRALKAGQPKESKKSRAVFLLAPFKAIRKLWLKLSEVKALKPVFVVLRFLGKIIWPTYFRNSFNELKGVTWPTPKMSVRLTYAVLAFAVVFGVAIALVDLVLDKVFKVLLLK